MIVRSILIAVSAVIIGRLSVSENEGEITLPQLIRGSCLALGELWLIPPLQFPDISLVEPVVLFGVGIITYLPDRVYFLPHWLVFKVYTQKRFTRFFRIPLKEHLLALIAGIMFGIAFACMLSQV